MMSSRLMKEHQLMLDRYALLAAIAKAASGRQAASPFIVPVIATHDEFC